MSHTHNAIQLCKRSKSIYSKSPKVIQCHCPVISRHCHGTRDFTVNIY